MKTYKNEITGILPIESFLSVVSLLEYEKVNQSAASANALQVPPALMIERYFSLHYKNVISEKLQNRMENRAFGGFPRNPFKPTISGPY